VEPKKSVGKICVFKKSSESLEKKINDEEKLLKARGYSIAEMFSRKLMLFDPVLLSGIKIERNMKHLYGSLAFCKGLFIKDVL
jgi:hypothetical protein